MLVLIGSVFFEPGEDVSDLGDEVARARGDAVRSLLDAHQRGVNLAQLQRLVELLGLGHSD